MESSNIPSSDHFIEMDNLPELPAGIYVLNVYAENRKLNSFKLVK